MKLTEAGGIRISFKELLLMKSIADTMVKHGKKDEDGFVWVTGKDLAATSRNLTPSALPSILNKAIGNDLIELDRDRIRLTRLGKNVLKSAEPQYAKQLEEAVKRGPAETELHSHELVDLAREDDYTGFAELMMTMIKDMEIWLTRREVEKLMALVRRGKKLYHVISDKVSDNFGMDLRLDYKKRGYKLIAFTEKVDKGEYLYVR